MPNLPKVDRVLLWLFERQPGESVWRMRAKIAGLTVVGTLLVICAFQGIRWLAMSW